MDKQHEAQSDSISAVGVQIKEYPPSEVYSSEPPPAYVRSKGSTAVQIARIAAVTLVAVSFIIGFFMVASAYVTASVTCYQDYSAVSQQENVEDRPTFQHLVVDPMDSDELNDNNNNKLDSAMSAGENHGRRQRQEEDSQNQVDESQPSESREETKTFKLPLMLDFDELAGSMLEKNQKSKMNCVVEKRKAEEVMDHQPKTVRLPFGLNLTTDPRYEHITGERMAIFCESGNEQRHGPSEQEQQMPFMQIVPIQVHQMPLSNPNAIPHRQPMIPTFPIHQFPPQIHGQPSSLEHQEQRHLPHQMIPPQVLQAVQRELAAEQMAAQQAQLRQHRRLPPQLPAQFIPESDNIIIQEEVIPVYQGVHPPHPHPRPEGRSMEHHPVEHQTIVMPGDHQQPSVPSDTVRPPPPPFVNLHDRPHFVQPRSIRSVENPLKPRVRRCACDCAC